ncbi:MAG: YggS family pyridoxal phosphate-dependent enzyme [Betaproteobacteria bacterium]|nr:YggS family pyridoxal phosphate-dependent enzyme [Betaproteobacteria bacterium]HAT53262.1 YggS family pyridoxal phosphate-dependent enzyme [Betaproteobacteria bacterium]HAU83840.1 YggS family pyridoxal phosphate-dependent enzyme [Betaproteobacteria bacterium]
MTQAYPHIKDNLEAVRARIASALSHAGRSQQETQLIAVSKKFSEELIREAYLSGQKHFGENYVQEATNKIDKLSDLPLEWHFIGPIQSNKTGQIATKFDWVHSVDRLKIAQRLSQARSASGSSLKICLQVNITEEESKQGCSVADLVELAQSVERLPNLEFRGLMTMPRAKASNQDIVDTFRRLAELKNALNQEGLKLDVLSMGMSDDLEIGIQEGATFVRVGRGIFGNR